VQGGATVKVSVANLTAGRAVSASSLDVTQPITTTYTGTYAISSTSAATGPTAINFYNTSGNLILGTEGSAGGALLTGSTAYSVIFSSYANKAIHFGTNALLRATIDASGNFNVNTTTPIGSGKTNVSFDGASAQGMNLQTTYASVGSGYLGFYNSAGTNIGSVTQSTGSAVLYNVTSDQRLKENIQDADSASELIDSLQVRQFDWKTDNTHQRHGFIAQELVAVVPEAVYQPRNEEEMMAVDYSKLVPMLVKEIQSLRKRIAAIEPVAL
jgi:hypothetical protein